MQRLEIKGGRKISGTINISGSKNATLPILAATILTNKKIIIKKNNEYYRPSDVSFLKGDAKEAKQYLDWKPKIKFKELVTIMVEADKKRSLKGRILQ